MDWILLRGLTREQAHWGDFRQRLQMAFPEHRFHAVDFPGTGVFYRELSPATVAGIRAWVQRRIQHIPKPVSLLALSMGSEVALEWAQHAPAGEVQNLVLINASTGFSRPWQRLRPSALPKLLRLLARRELFERERQLLSLCSNRSLPLELIKAWYRVQRQRPVSAGTFLRQLGAVMRYRPDNKRPMPMALLLASRADRLVDWHCSAALEQRWQWPLKLHPSAGHDLILDAPDWVIGRLEDWLRY